MGKRERRKVFTRGGRWWGVVGPPDGRSTRVSLGLPDTAPETKAIEVWLKEQQDHRTSDDAASTAPRLKECFESYLADMKRREKAGDTIKIDRTKSGHFTRMWGDRMPVQNITGDRVMKFIEKREGEGAKATTIRRELDVLRRMLKLAIFRGWFNTPLERVMPEFSPEYKPVERWAKPEELRALCRVMSPDRAAWIVYVVATGCRRADVFRAHKSDPDFEKHVCLVRGSKTPASWKKITLTRMQETLIKWALKHTKPLLDGRLFRPWASLSRDLHAACRRAKIPSLTPNDLRRTLGHWLRHAGLEPQLIAKQLRHTSSDMAERVYAKGEVDALGSLIRERVRAVPQIVPDRVRKSRYERRMTTQKRREKRKSRSAA